MAAPKVQFNRDIRPILAENCLYCHGPDKNHRQADLRLDQADSARAKGAVVPGKPDQSSLVKRIFATDAGQMPPVSSHKSLTLTQKNLLRAWISEGAVYEAHWAYIPPRPLPVPTVQPVAGSPTFPIRNPIDAFILERLTAKKIAPSPQTDPRTLIRRVSLDLTGMPPTASEVEAFLADKSPNAYERLVDRLLKSPHYGERMAVPWLDVVRYSDTVGFHGDQNQNSWAYRDYVIDAFNSNMGFDRFTIEQLAGDLLPNPTAEQRTATCFNRLNMVTREGGAQPKEYLAKYAADRVRTVGMAWLGSTFACAECHNHKYDPITQKDFYSLSAFFSDIKQWGVYNDYGYTPNPDLKGFTNDHPFPPEITVQSRYLTERIARLKGQMEAVALANRAGATDKSKPFVEWRKEALRFLAEHPDGWQLFAPSGTSHFSTAAVVAKRRTAGAKPTTSTPKPAPESSADDDTLKPQSDGSLLVTGTKMGGVTLDLTPQSGYIASLRLEALPHADNGNSILRAGAKSAVVMMTVQVESKGGVRRNLTFRYAGADAWEPEYSNGYDRIGVHRGWKLGPSLGRSPHTSVWLLDQPAYLNEGDTLHVTLPSLGLGCIRLSASMFVPDNLASPVLPGRLRERIEKYEGTANTPADPLVLQEYLFSTAWQPTAYATLKSLELKIAECRGGRTPVMVTEAWKPAVARVLPRGNWQDESGEVVVPATPHFLPGYEVPGEKRLTRLDLAKWLVSPENALTSRVFVNRVWKQFFGNGLSGLVEDLGMQGEWPTHPELLDWLALRFSRGGNGVASWDIKALVRLIVTSSTYRQRASLRPELRELDPNNRLLASQNPRRLEAEFVRDNALAIAGLLNDEVGGPSCKPYQPAGYYGNIQFPNRDYINDTDDGQYRRGVYMHWQRTFLHPMLANFDAPSREDCIAARNVANTPQQALTLLNDTTFVEAAKAFGVQLLRLGKDDTARLEMAYQRALCRSPKPKERQSLLAFLAKMRAAYKERPEDAKQLLTVGLVPVPEKVDAVELASWINVCRVILNLNETITRY